MGCSSSDINFLNCPRWDLEASGELGRSNPLEENILNATMLPRLVSGAQKPECES